MSGFLNIFLAQGATGSELILGSNATMYWPLNSGSPFVNDGTGDPPDLFNLNVVGGSGGAFDGPSLLLSGEGSSFSTAPAAYVSSDDIPYVLDQGFTVEYIIQPISAYTSAGDTTCVSVHTMSNSPVGAFTLRWDNYTGSPRSFLQANFFLQTPNVIDSYTDYLVGGVVIMEVRSEQRLRPFGSPLPIYHLLGTYSPTLKRLDVYVDGVLQGSTDTSLIAGSPHNTWVDAGALDNRDRGSNARMEIGAQLVNGAWRFGQEGYIDEVIIHEGVFMDEAQAAVQASVAKLQ